MTPIAPAPAAPASPSLDGAAERAAVAFAYHARSKHALTGYAAGPETLDWDLQPDPFRTYEGAPQTPLPLGAQDLTVPFSALRRGGVPARAPELAAVGLLLELSFGLSAWKEFGPDRWALRCNPSSGNLHPTEAYVVAQNVQGLADGVHHYVSRDHVLEQRCPLPVAPDGTPRLFVGLSSIHWREAWKYGERALRYCALDTGHALAALTYAAAALGWTARLVEGRSDAAFAALLGLDRAEDFGAAERETPEALVALAFGPETRPAHPPAPPLAGWRGTANRLDRHPMYRWPVIDAVARATTAQDAASGGASMDVCPPSPPEGAGEEGGSPRAAEGPTAAAVILGRRSAQRFDAKARMPLSTFARLLAALMPHARAPFDLWSYAPAIHPVLFVHRVEGLAPGLYALPRTLEAGERLRRALRADFTFEPVEGVSAAVPLRHLILTDVRGLARTVCCHQAIAGDSAFALAFLADFAGPVAADPFRYRQLFWEAGMLGQALYLAAEAEGVRGTGIGCFFDEDLHRLIGLSGDEFQSLYHFTVGTPLSDARLSTLPAYPGRRP